MKRTVSLVLSFLMMILMFSGCKKAETVETGKDQVKANEEAFVLGKLAYIGMHYEPGEEPEEYKKQVEENRQALPSGDMPSRDMPSGDIPEMPSGDMPGTPGEMKQTVKYYDTQNALSLALLSGDVSMISVPSCVADYMIKTNNKFTIADLSVPQAGASSDNPEPQVKPEKTFTDTSFSMLLLEENKELRDEIDKAILELYQDGTLRKLKEKYIDNMDTSAWEPVTHNAGGNRTLTVAVTGDLPPMDYVDDTGNPAGFNTALVYAIGDKLGANIKFITIDSAARAAALKSGRADIVFWAASFNYMQVNPFMGALDTDSLASYSSEVVYGDDVAEGTIITVPYFYDYYESVELAK